MAAGPITIMDRGLLDEVSSQASQAPRRRKNHNFHPADDFPSHRLLNAMEPGSYIRPHRHQDPSKDESIVVVRGRFGAVGFDAAGNVVQSRVLSACGDAFAVDIPHGVYHTIVCLETGSVFFEAKAGPYVPLSEEEKAAWAPEEGAAGAAEYLQALEKLFSP